MLDGTIGSSYTPLFDPTTSWTFRSCTKDTGKADSLTITIDTFFECSFPQCCIVASLLLAMGLTCRVSLGETLSYVRRTVDLTRNCVLPSIRRFRNLIGIAPLSPGIRASLVRLSFVLRLVKTALLLCARRCGRSLRFSSNLCCRVSSLRLQIPEDLNLKRCPSQPKPHRVRLVPHNLRHDT